MTNEEAINTLNSLKQYYNDKNEDSYVGFDDEDNEALDKAIKTLEREDVLNKVVTEIQELDGKVCRQFLIEDVDKEVHRAYQDCLQIINKYRKVKKND